VKDGNGEDHLKLIKTCRKVLECHFNKLLIRSKGGFVLFFFFTIGLFLIYGNGHVCDIILKYIKIDSYLYQ